MHVAMNNTHAQHTAKYQARPPVLPPLNGVIAVT